MLDRRERLRRWIPQNSGESSTRGANHIAVFARDLDATARFYTEVMGMPVIEVIGNLDEAQSTHMNVNIGGGMMLSFFDFPHVPRLRRRAPEGTGNVMHIAIDVTEERKAEIKARLAAADVPHMEMEGSVYIKDPNGLGIELLPLGGERTPGQSGD
jgi:catechol 2,3-dioxygenase-like lactoylglutathione lyase family enzyme